MVFWVASYGSNSYPGLGPMKYLCVQIVNVCGFVFTGLSLCACCPGGLPGARHTPASPVGVPAPGLPPMLAGHEHRSSSVADLRRKARQHSEALAMEMLGPGHPASLIPSPASSAATSVTSPSLTSSSHRSRTPSPRKLDWVPSCP